MTSEGVQEARFSSDIVDLEDDTLLCVLVKNLVLDNSYLFTFLDLGRHLLSSFLVSIKRCSDLADLLNLGCGV